MSAEYVEVEPATRAIDLRLVEALGDLAANTTRSDSVAGKPAEDMPVTARGRTFTETCIGSTFEELGIQVTQRQVEGFAEEVLFPTYRGRRKIATSVDRSEQIRLIIQGAPSNQVAELTDTTVKSVDTGRTQFIALFHKSGFTPGLLRTAFTLYCRGIEGAAIADGLQELVGQTMGVRKRPYRSETTSREVDPSEEVKDGLFGTPVAAEDQDEDQAEELLKDVSLYGGDTIRAYLNEIGKVPLLTAEQEVELAKRIEAGLYADYKLNSEETCSHLSAQEQAELIAIREDGAKAKKHMIEANLRLVVSVAKRYINRGMPFLDLIQEGNLGLFRAVEKFDYMKGYKFSTYATWWIRQKITRELANQGRTIRLPVHIADTVRKISLIGARLQDELGRPATAEELAAELGMSVETLIDLRQHTREPISLDARINEGSDTIRADMVEDATMPDPGDIVVQQSVVAAVQHALNRSGLSRKERAVLELRFGIGTDKPLMLDEIGKRFGVTRERIRQVEAKALKKVQASPVVVALEPYVR